MLGNAQQAMYNPAQPSNPVPPGGWTNNRVGEAHLKTEGSEQLSEKGYEAYLSNIPETARLSHVMGALRKFLEGFRALNLIKLYCGSCKVVFEKKEKRDKLLKEPFIVFTTTVKVSLTPPATGETWPTVHITGLPPGTSVKQLLGAIKKQIGEFQATNTLVIINGCSKIRFKDVKKQESLLAKGLTICNVPVMLSKQPPSFPGVGVGMKRGFPGQFGVPQMDPFMKRRRLANGGMFAAPQPMPVQMGQLRAQPLSTEEMQLDINRLNLRVRYLEEQVAMYEQWFAIKRAQTAATVATFAPGPGLPPGAGTAAGLGGMPGYNTAMW